MMEKIIGWLSKLPTTNTRIAVTLILCVGTAVKYWASKTWEPTWDWLGFLLVMSGLDVTQFGVKRKTHITNSGGAS